MPPELAKTEDGLSKRHLYAFPPDSCPDLHPAQSSGEKSISVAFFPGGTMGKQ